MTDCYFYKNEASCILSLDDPCIYTTLDGTESVANKICRSKTCSDFSNTTTAECKANLKSVDCVSDGVTCLKKALCNTYVT